MEGEEHTKPCKNLVKIHIQSNYFVPVATALNSNILRWICYWVLFNFFHILYMHNSCTTWSSSLSFYQIHSVIYLHKLRMPYYLDEEQTITAVANLAYSIFLFAFKFSVYSFVMEKCVWCGAVPMAQWVCRYRWKLWEAGSFLLSLHEFLGSNSGSQTCGASSVTSWAILAALFTNGLQ